jgi:hypothetical protein
MKNAITFILLLFYSITFSQSEGNSVRPFLQKIVSQFPNVRDIALTQDQDEAIFSAQSAMGDMSVLVRVKQINGKWETPEVLSISGRYFDLEPFFSKDGLTLYFASNRPLDQTSDATKDFDIWVANRKSKDDNWSEPINIGAPINTELDEFYPSVTDSKNIYFTLDNPELKQKDDIYFSEFVSGSYTAPIRLGSEVNSEGYEFNAYVAKDESFIIYTCYNKEGGYGSGDLYMSTKLENGKWSISKNMGNQINSDKMDYCPYVDIATNTLYFTSKRNALKPTFESKVELQEVLKTFHSYENGLSRLYYISLEGFLTN